MKIMYFVILFLLSIGILFIAADYAYSNERNINIVGSSTVYPFTTIVAEKYAKEGNPSPIVESTGTGGGIKIFCEENSPADAVNASRKFKDTELITCMQNGYSHIRELQIGYDGIVLATSKQFQDMNLTLEQIWLALAKNVIINDQVVPNPYLKWSDIDTTLPQIKINVLGPPPTSGTRDVFVEMVLQQGCKKYTDDKTLCSEIREDGAYIDAGENDNLIVKKIEENDIAIGVFGYSFLEENLSHIKGIAINGVEPNYDTILDKSYILSRPLFVYFKDNDNLNNFIDLYINSLEDLSEKGLIPIENEGKIKVIN